jgi:trehalose 6-phosphate phosphatase
VVVTHIEVLTRPFTGDDFVLQFDPHNQIDASQSALFLDFDGTLVDIAATPQLIVVPEDLPQLIEELQQVFEGRLCIVSGRPLNDIHRYLKTTEIDVLAEHGAVQSLLGSAPNQLHVWPTSWNEHLLTLDRCIPNLVIETKTTSVALHYRQQPELEPEVMRLAEVLRNHAPNEYMIVNSNMTTEIRRSGVDKGTAIDAAMKNPRYRDRKPIFIADDVTDMPGFEVVCEMSGLAINVHRDFAGKTENVRQWLQRFTTQKRAA